MAILIIILVCFSITTYNHGLVSGLKYLFNNSDSSSLKGNGKLDFTGSGYYDINTTNTLYVTETSQDGKLAHNGYNFGNFLWGAAASQLKIPGWIARMGAHFNNFFLDNHYKYHFDSKDDQKSIQTGINWSNEYNCKNHN